MTAVMAKEFIGQQRVVRYLKDLYLAALKSGIPADVLLVGPQGGGKTTIAEQIAGWVGAKLVRLLGGKDVTALAIAELLAKRNHFDVILLDEAHALPIDAQQVLYGYLDARRVPAVTPDRKLDRAEWITAAPCNVVLATTKPSGVVAPLRSRLDVVWLDRYSIDELKQMAVKVIGDSRLTISTQAARVLAERAQGSPRIVQRFARDLVRLSGVVPGSGGDKPDLNQSHVERFFRRKGISRVEGLDVKQIEYVRALGASPRGRSTLERLAAKLAGADERYLRQEVEVYLLEIGAIVIDQRTRAITDYGRELIERLDREAAGEDEA